MSLWAIVAVVASPLAIGLMCLAGYAVRLAWWTTQVTRLPVFDHPDNHSVGFEDVAFPSRDGLALRGWYLPSQDDRRCVIFVQGEEHHRNSPGIRALELARDLVARGHSVFLFDLRGRGESAGHRGSAGNQELRDVLGAIDCVRTRGLPAERIALLGFSLGAGLALYAARREPSIGAIICDSCFKDLLDDYRAMRLWGVPLPRWLLAPLVGMAGRLLYDSDPGAMRPITIVHRLRPPLMLVHGEADDVVAPNDSLALHERAPRSILWLVPGARHVESYLTTRQEYVDRLASFLEGTAGRRTQTGSKIVRSPGGGGRAQAAKLTPEQRREIGRKAADKRWHKP